MEQDVNLSQKNSSVFFSNAGCVFALVGHVEDTKIIFYDFVALLIECNMRNIFLEK